MEVSKRKVSIEFDDGNEETVKSQKGIKNISDLKRKWKEQKFMRKVQKLEKEICKKTELEKETDDRHNNTNEISSVSLHPTLSIAVPGSILDNAQSVELRTYLAGQIARAACIFKVNEVIVFDDLAITNTTKKIEVDEGLFGVKSARRCCVQLARILMYLECPQYLRKDYFPIHKDLTYAGLLNPLNAPHHLHQDEEFPFREGIVTNIPTKPGRSVVNVGMRKHIIVDKALVPGLRVTTRILNPKEGSKKIYGTVVAPSTPTAETGAYWGYSVRIAPTLGKVKLSSPYEDGYDLIIGTSDKGKHVDEIPESYFSNYKHILIVFGGLEGLEAALENDEEEDEDPDNFFHHYINTCPDQGSRTIRTEEAILISLTALRTKISADIKKH